MAKRYFFIFAILLLISFGTIRPLLNNGIFPMHDDTQVGRVIVMGKALRNGQFPVRWVSDLGYGYGYPLFNYYGPLPYYVGGFLYALGVPPLESIKAMMGIGFILSGITMFMLARSRFDTAGGFISAILYMYAPYHAVQGYVRGSVGELWAYAFLPLVAWGILNLLDDAKRRGTILVGGIGLAGIILSHTIFGYVVTGVGLIFGLFYGGAYMFVKRYFVWQPMLDFGLLMGIGLSLSAFFWLPAAFEMSATSVSGQVGPTANFRDHFVCLFQLWNAPWGFGGSTQGCVDGMSFKIGKIHLILAAASLIVWFLKRKTYLSLQSYMIGGIMISMISIFFMLQTSQIFWELIPNAAFVQYPWRLLMVANLGISMIAAALVVVSHNRLLRTAIAGTVCVLVTLVNAKWFAPQYMIERPLYSYESEEELRYRVSKISDEYLPSDFIRPQKAADVPHEVLSASSLYKADIEVDTETYVKALLTSNEDTEVTIQRIYFPGWNYQVNGKSIVPKIRNSLPTIAIPSGESVLEINFYNTPIRIVGNLISIISLASLVILYGTKKTSSSIA
ncbi:hypothetical protein HY948_04425 [Candidatus Gottesmanbacteria bacterium]|nr:hypothetical protein [Candidatus Gottesmanbacteria bacterium]